MRLPGRPLETLLWLCSWPAHRLRRRLYIAVVDSNRAAAKGDKRP